MRGRGSWAGQVSTVLQRFAAADHRALGPPLRPACGTAMDSTSRGTGSWHASRSRSRYLRRRHSVPSRLPPTCLRPGSCSASWRPSVPTLVPRPLVHAARGRCRPVVQVPWSSPRCVCRTGAAEDVDWGANLVSRDAVYRAYSPVGQLLSVHASVSPAPPSLRLHRITTAPESQTMDLTVSAATLV